MCASGMSGRRAVCLFVIDEKPDQCALTGAPRPVDMHHRARAVGARGELAQQRAQVRRQNPPPQPVADPGGVHLRGCGHARLRVQHHRGDGHRSVGANCQPDSTVHVRHSGQREHTTFRNWFEAANPQTGTGVPTGQPTVHATADQRYLAILQGDGDGGS